MKLRYLLTGLFLLSLYSFSFAQARAFRDFIIAANSPTNPKLRDSGFKTFGGKDRFELEDWASGWAISRGDELIKDGYSFNFDYENNDLFVRKNDENLVIVVDKNSVRRFSIFNGVDSIRFVKSISLDPTNKIFFQLLGGSTSGKVALLKHRTAKVVPVDKNDYARNFNGDYKPVYRNQETYYFVDRDKGVKEYRNINQKELLAFYPEHQDLIMKFIKGKKGVEDRDLALLISAINELYVAQP